MRRIIGTAIASVIAVGLMAPVAGATYNPNPCDGRALAKGECPPAQPLPRTECPPIHVALRIAESVRGGAKFQTVTVTAANDNLDTNAGALDVALVVVYQSNRWRSVPHTILADIVADGGGTFSASFEVPRWRQVDGQVVAFLDDIGCDRVNETVALA